MYYVIIHKYRMKLPTVASFGANFPSLFIGAGISSAARPDRPTTARRALEIEAKRYENDSGTGTRLAPAATVQSRCHGSGREAANGDSD